MGSTFTMLTHLVVGPFIGILGEKAERELHNPDYPQHTVAQVVMRSLARECRKLVYWLILYFIPGVNAVVPILWFMFGSWILAMQYLDVPADNNGHSFQEVLVLMRQHRAAVMAFGAVVMALTSLPIINLFIIPVAVCGGVVFWVRKVQPEMV